MRFDEALEKVQELLQRQEQVSYPALQLRFILDEVYLEALKKLLHAPARRRAACAGAVGREHRADTARPGGLCRRSLKDSVSRLARRGVWGTRQEDEGLAAIAEALRLVDKNDERLYEAEGYRIKGELLLAQAGKLRD